MLIFIATVLSYLPYAAVTAFTPGPNNIVALYAVGQSGWRQGRKTLWGIGAGFLFVMLVCGFFCFEIARFMPAVSSVLKYPGAAYILWLALHVARSRPGKQEAQSVSFGRGFFLQLVNVKIILYAFTAYTGYVLPVSGSLWFLAGHALCFTLVGMAGTLTWAAAGGVLQEFLAKHSRPFNYAMALVLTFCAIQLL